MSNSNFNTVSPNQTPLDPKKRVKYSMGLVLGVEEFEQEQYYLMERDRLHQRALHGYGTVSGLKVSLTDDSGDIDVTVSPGIAVNPRGDTVCVPDNQCASLADWLADNTTEIDTQMAELEGDAPLPLYITLCYKECPTDDVPIPGAPCQSKENVVAPSRISDYFELSITTTPPEQLEEQYVRCFGKFLRRIEISKYAPNPLDEDQLVNELKTLFTGMGSPPECPLDDVGSPPDIEKYYISPDNAAGILEAVFRAWVTDVRPTLLEQSGVCGPYSGNNKTSGLCVLLAQLDVNVTKSGGTWQVDGDIADIGIIEDRRPVLLHTRLLQEWLLFSGYEPMKPDTHTFVSLGAKLPDVLVAWVHYPVPLDIQAGYVSVEIDGANIVPASLQNLPGTNVFRITLPAPLDERSLVKVGFDVTQITLTGGPDSGKRLADVLHELEYIYLDRDGDWLWSYSIVLIPKLDDLFDVDVPSPGHDQILTWDKVTGRWVATDKPVVITEHHDLNGHDDYDDHPQYLNVTRANVWGDARYSRLNHNHMLNNLSDVNAAGLAGGYVLQWNTGQNKWLPGPIPSGGLSLDEIAAQLPVLPFVTVKRTEPNLKYPEYPAFELWFHLNAASYLPQANTPELVPDFSLQVFGEKVDPTPISWPYMTSIGVINLEPAANKRNVYLLSVNTTVDNFQYLRFIFNTDNMTLIDPAVSLSEWIKSRPMKWLGHDGQNTVTAFYENSGGTGTQEAYVVAAAGAFDVEGMPVGKTLNGLQAQGGSGTDFLLTFDGYDLKKAYIVKGTAVAGPDKGEMFVFELVAPPQENGIPVKVSDNQGQPPEFGFMVEISEIL